MNIIYKILVVSILVVSLGLARTSGNFSSSDSFFSKTGNDNKPLIVEDERSNNEEGSLKWKRRHKRRKKAPNRRPRRGK
jgi:hypothetical protein